MPTRVSSEMNEALDRPYTAQEVERALFSMGTCKAPGPDGFIAGFYQTHWETVGPSITNAVLDFFEWRAVAGRHESDVKNQASAGSQKL